MKHWIKKTYGCVTEYTHPEYGRLVKKFNRFYVISQFDDVEGLEYALVNPTFPAQYRVDARCSYGDVLYGVSADGSLTKLKAIIDSSD